MEEIRTRYERYSALFGREVEVTVNRPLGSSPRDRNGRDRNVHDRDIHDRDNQNRAGSNPRRRQYPLNCGYLTRSVTTDGKETAPRYPDFQYAYILGVDEPVRTFRGRVIAVLHRETEEEEAGTAPETEAETENVSPCMLSSCDRLIVAPENVEFYEPDIRNAVAFAERFHRCRLYCMYEKSCGAVVYTVRDGTFLYLLIRNRSGHIGFPKGHVELGEDERMTMKREISEETALSVEPDLAFREEYRYVLWNIVHKTAVYSLASFRYGETVETMENEIFGDWLLPYPEARRMLSYENDRRILDRADAWLHGRMAARQYDGINLRNE